MDKNFAVHLPVLDWLFGTYYLPDRWPSAYGPAEGKVPEGYFPQMAYPFRLLVQPAPDPKEITKEGR